MSKLDAIKTFRDLLAFLTIIPVGKTEDFVVTSAEYLYLFPLVGGMIGLLAAGYFAVSDFVVSGLVSLVNHVVAFSGGFLVSVVPAFLTIAFLLVLTGLQHFDGLIDLGNAIGLSKLEDRRAAAHAWIVTYKGAILAFVVEFAAVLGLSLLSHDIAVRAIISAEIAAKVAMVTILAVGKPTHKGLGAYFLEKGKRRRNFIAFAIASLIVIPLLGWVGLLVVVAGFLSGVVMERVAANVFGGVSGDMIGATNEVSRAVALVLLAGVFWL
jgi:adenosylcobinamide-GDP ribazoletransferase